MGNLITILITVVSGVLVYIIGEILQTVWLTPLQKFKAIKHDIAVTLTFYARIYTNIIDAAHSTMSAIEEYSEASDKIRNLSCELKGYIETLSWIKIGIPSKKKLFEAANLLMRLSNSLFSPYNVAPTAQDNIENKNVADQEFALLGMYSKKKSKKTNKLL